MGLLSRLEVPNHGGSRWLDNEDLRPFPRERRTWGFLFFNLFWLSAVPNVSNMISGSSFLSFGLTFYEGVAASTAGFFLVSWFMLFNGRGGAFWHISFPVQSRASFGILGAAWPTLNRAAMGIVWNGVNSVSGAQCLYTMFYAVFPSLKNLKNTMSSGSALSSAEYIFFFVFLALTGFMLLLDARRWSILVYAKLVIFTLSAIGMIVLGVRSAGGVGPVVSTPSRIHGSEKAWLIVRFILTSAASCSTFASNAADWQRNATKPNDVVIGQIVGFPLANFIVQCVGMLIASTSAGVYGEVIWNPVQYMQMLLEDDFNPGRRVGVFFIAGGFVFSLLYSCVIENCYCAANDLAGLVPRFLSVKRAYVVCLIGTVVIMPQYLLGSASIFISVLASYQIFLFSIMAVMMAHYYLVAKGLLDIEGLYTADKRGTYYYTYGVNLRAIVAYFVGVAVNFAGFLQNLGVVEVDNVDLARSYYFSIFTTTFAAGGSYYLMCRFFPQLDYQTRWSEPKGGYEPDSPAKPFEPSATDEEKSSVDEFDKGEDGVVSRTVEVPELRA
ncbi:uncharacterized protein JCM6883_000236 [Sporobolomyces salmoneus]|uniref:uncharacterized protein n=1 Tax=Sporobolomyces salmoneus TaxID=183962 RepID=UPI003173793B